MLGEASKRSFSNLTMKGKKAVRTWPAKLQDGLHVPTFTVASLETSHQEMMAENLIPIMRCPLSEQIMHSCVFGACNLHKDSRH